jgi:energy-coupling factor transporter ATP-binding protein EcfA2
MTRASDDRQLTDADVCLILGRRAIGKLELVLTAEGVYKREADGRWYRLSSEPAT